jgi:hypothetical protein
MNDQLIRNPVRNVQLFIRHRGGDIIVFHQERTEYNFFQHLPDVFQFLRPLHVLVPVDICIDLHPEKRKTQAVEHRLVQSNRFPVDGLEKIGEYTDIFKGGEDSGKYR